MTPRSLPLLTLLLAFPAALIAQARTDLDVPAPDGAILKATHYSPGRPGPGVLLLHQCNMDRTSWVALAEALRAAGLHVMTLDYRGYGESAERTTPANLGTIPRKWPADVDAAFAVFLAQPGVDSTRVAAGGASCGVNQSVNLARRSGRIDALVLLSGNTDSTGHAFLARRPDLPVFGAASTGDGNAVPTMRRLVSHSRHPATIFRELSNAGHGVPMFSAEPSLLPQIVEWVKASLR